MSRTRCKSTEVQININLDESVTDQPLLSWYLSVLFLQHLLAHYFLVVLGFFSAQNLRSALALPVDRLLFCVSFFFWILMPKY